eukprot:3941644-Rhodomonas_salina.21
MQACYHAAAAIEMHRDQDLLSHRGACWFQGPIACGSMPMRRRLALLLRAHAPLSSSLKSGISLWIRVALTVSYGA